MIAEKALKADTAVNPYRGFISSTSDSGCLTLDNGITRICVMAEALKHILEQLCGDDHDRSIIL